MASYHTFHIPVMGTAYTVDTPYKVAHLGIDSVISIVDDFLLENMRKMYSGLLSMPYKEISTKMEDYRANRITSYLNLMHEMVEQKVEQFLLSASEKTEEIKKYFEMLPDGEEVKKEFFEWLHQHPKLEGMTQWVRERFVPGSIDVNIMTKVDKVNFKNNEKLPGEYNDAHAALRGFAQSKLTSSLILSAGMNPRLYAYIEAFDDFYPDTGGNIKKKIVLKVSDYRSALIQGRFLAKKGIWVSEYRIESGLNCGGHAFATDGYLMGPILEEFKKNKSDLQKTVFDILVKALAAKERPVPTSPLPIKITAQGGVGTPEEHAFLLEHYEVDAVGWGTPFLLVPEVTTVDEDTRKLLVAAKEEDLYLSEISPLGVPFNSLRTNTKAEEEYRKAATGKSGSACPKRLLALSTEYSDKGVCLASRQYHRIKEKEWEQAHLSQEERQREKEKMLQKTCLCVGLSTTAHLVHGFEVKHGKGVSICPGPNLAYFTQEMTLEEITDHIYGRSDKELIRQDRPHMFIKELNLYLDYLGNKIRQVKDSMDKKQEKYFRKFTQNLSDGIDYYQKLTGAMKDKFGDLVHDFQKGLHAGKRQLDRLEESVEQLTEPVAP